MTYSRILIATDLSEESAEAAALALRLAHPRTRYRVAFVLPTPWPPLSNAPRTPPDHETLALVTAWATRWGLGEAEIALPRGGVAKELVREADSFRADLIVLGHKGQTRAPRRLLGSTARAVMRSAHVDTLIVRDGFPQEREPVLQSLLVATDFHEPSKHAAHRAAQIGKQHESDITVAHVVDPGLWYDPSVVPPEDALDGWLETGIQERLSDFNELLFHGRATAVVLHGRPAVALAKHARDHAADLLLIGNHGAGALERAMIGSTAETIVELAPCSVLVVRGG